MNSEELNIEFLKHKDSAYRYAATLLHAPAEAEDVTQDLYERLWRRRLLVRRAGFRALVMTTVRNMCLDIFCCERLPRILPLSSLRITLISSAENFFLPTIVSF